jgi:glycosyltransferase involved in cell wall biosynthesis
MIPNIVHFVFGLAEQDEPFHLLHYVSIESCRRRLAPDCIYLHYKHLPWGPYFDLVAPHLTLVECGLAQPVLDTAYSPELVPERYLYAHHADFVRLDALIEHGGVYADIDTVFARAIPAHLYEHPFVIGRESPVADELTGIRRESLCNALLMAEPGSGFARAWRDRMAEALNGTWSNHSGFLAEELSRSLPGLVHVEPAGTFFPFGADPDGIDALLREHRRFPEDAASVHLWAHLWWHRERRDFSLAQEGWCTPPALRHAATTLADLVRPYLPAEGGWGGGGAAPERWLYVSLDEISGYGVAADRCRAALEGSGLTVDWLPLVPGDGWGMSYEPGFELDAGATGPGSVVVAHVVPEFLGRVRDEHPDSLLVSHTVWETDRLPHHWPECLEAADLVVVPSRFNASVMESADLGRPVAVVPHVAPDVGAPARGDWVDPGDDVTVFYTIAEWTERKAVSLTIEAFARAFGRDDKVLLVVKTTYLDVRVPFVEGARVARPGTTPFALARLLAGRPDPPPIHLVTRHLSDAEIAGLHRRGDCYVSLARSEGWGLGAFDAACFGNPVVTTGFGGQLDYLGGTPYLVDYTLVPVHSSPGTASYTEDQRWADPDVDHAAALLRRVAADPKEAAAAARARAGDLRATYSPDAVAAAMRSAVESVRSGAGTGGSPS